MLFQGKCCNEKVWFHDMKIVKIKRMANLQPQKAHPTCEFVVVLFCLVSSFAIMVRQTGRPKFWQFKKKLISSHL